MYRCYISRIIKNRTEVRMSDINLGSSIEFKDHANRKCVSELYITPAREVASRPCQSSTDCTTLCEINTFQQYVLSESETVSIGQTEPSIQNEADIDEEAESDEYLSSRESYHSVSIKELSTKEVPAATNLAEITCEDKSPSQREEHGIRLHEEREQFDTTETSDQLTLTLNNNEISEQRILSESKFLHSQTFTVEFGNETKEGLSLQKAFNRFKQQRQNEIKKERKCKKVPSALLLRTMSNPDRMWKLRMKFLNQAKKYFGTPYSRKYWTSEDAEYYSPLFLDCCGLVRKVLQDLRDKFLFRIGPWNQAYMFDTLPITVASSEDMKPGDLVFISAIYHNPNAKKQKHNMNHVEIWLGEGIKTIGARWQKGKVQVFDSYKFDATSYHSPIYILKSIDTWLMGICKSHCPEHPWKRKSEFKPTRKSVFATSSTEQLNQQNISLTRPAYEQCKEEQEPAEEPSLQQEESEYRQGENLKHEQDQQHNSEIPENGGRQFFQKQLRENLFEQDVQFSGHQLEDQQQRGQLPGEKELGGQLLKKQLNGQLLEEKELSGFEENQQMEQLLRQKPNVQFDSKQPMHNPCETVVAREYTLKTLQQKEALFERQQYYASSHTGTQQNHMCDDDKEMHSIQLNLERLKISGDQSTEIAEM